MSALIKYYYMWKKNRGHASHMDRKMRREPSRPPIVGDGSSSDDSDSDMDTVGVPKVSALFAFLWYSLLSAAILQQSSHAAKFLASFLFFAEWQHHTADRQLLNLFLLLLFTRLLLWHSTRLLVFYV